MTPPGRLLIDPPQPGAWNMAVDEALLESAVTDHRITWRFYQWNEPTLSLGYFQTAAERAGHAAGRNCPMVRRASGGGAILHDHELTYSCAIPANHPLAIRRETLYDAVHRALVQIFAKLGVSLQLCGGGERKSPSPFLCFQRRTQGDLLVGDDKVGGSAQRRLHGAVLQHGSLLLQRSEAAPELPGILELTGKNVGPDDIIRAWRELRDTAWPNDWEPGSLTPAERDRAAHWEDVRYAADAWTLERRRC